MRLAQLKPARRCLIRGFADDMTDCYRRRLRELGFCEGAQVECVRHIPFGGPCIFKVGHAVFSLDAELSRQILITENPTEAATPL